MNKRGSVLISALIGILAAAMLGLTTDQIMQRVYDSSNSALQVTLVGGAPATSMTVGTTTITGGSNGRLLYDNSGVLGERANPLAIGFGGTGASSLTGSRCLQTNAGGTAIEVAAAVCGTGAGTVTGTGTTGLIPDWTSSTALGDSLAYRISVTNEGTTGTVASQLVKLTTAGTVIRTSAAETGGVLGICVSGCGTTGSAVVALLGKASCDFTNATTIGNYVVVSATVAGECEDTGSSTFPAAGATVLGRSGETGAAGIRSTFLATPDVASASQGGGGGGSKNPAGAAGDVQYRATGNNFAAEAAFNYDATNNRHTWTGLTSANDDTTNMFKVRGTMPTVPTTTVIGESHIITGAGSASQVNIAFDFEYLAGYTGSSRTSAMSILNNSSGTGTALNLNSTNTNPTGNIGVIAQAFGSTPTDTLMIGGFFAGRNTTGTAIGVMGKSDVNQASTNIGVLGNGASSTEATNLKNIAGWFTLGTTSPAAIASNTSVALGVDTSGSEDSQRWYDNGTLVATMADGGAFSTASTIMSSRATDIGWTVQAAANQACNTTCTSACVHGVDSAASTLLACTDATADSCLCAGNS